MSQTGQLRTHALQQKKLIRYLERDRWSESDQIETRQCRLWVKGAGSTLSGDFRSANQVFARLAHSQSFASLPETAAGRGYIGNAILRVDLRWYPLLDHSCHRSIHGCKQRIVRSAKPG